MKVLLGSLILTIILLVGNFILFMYIEKTSDEYSDTITEIEINIENNNWNNSLNSFNKLNKDWESTIKLWKLIVNHNEIDKIENSLARSEQFIINKNKDLSLGELASLKFYYGHIYIKEKINIQNIF